MNKFIKNPKESKRGRFKLKYIINNYLNLWNLGFVGCMDSFLLLGHCLGS
jgi:hypothetical protein